MHADWLEGRTMTGLQQTPASDALTRIGLLAGKLCHHTYAPAPGNAERGGGRLLGVVAPLW